MDRTVRILNKYLFWATAMVACYIIVMPLIPRAAFYIHDYLHPESTIKLLDLTQDPKVVQLRGRDPAPENNTLIIPKIGVDGPLLEGNSLAVLDKGIWHRPNTSTPAAGGNTVLVAHRYLYTTGANTFYNLDKLGVGDQFSLWWSGQRYDYVVYDVAVVPPTALGIEAPTTASIVTLYTCTPLWTAKNRLVVRGKLVHDKI